MMLDVFNADAFSVTSLTDAINNLKFVPGYLGTKGLFTPTGVATTTVAIESKNNILVIIAPTARGAPGNTLDHGKRSLLSVRVPHFEINDAVMAEEVQGIRPFGQESGEDSVMRVVGERLQTHTQSLDATDEYARVGAVKGLITYADGSVLDLYQTFNVTKPAVLDMNLDSTSNDGTLRQTISTGIIRPIGNGLGGTPVSGYEAICGDAFFDALIKNAEVRTTYLNYQAAAELRQPYIGTGGLSWATFSFGGVQWTNYRGSVTQPDGTVITFVPTNSAYVYPVGVPGLFRQYNAPADYMETVNTIGQPRYAKQYPMPNGKGVHLDAQSNQLSICTRPQALQELKTT